MDSQTICRGLYRRFPCAAPKAFEQIYRSIGSEVSVSLLDALTNRKYAEIVGAGIDPSAYSQAHKFALDYLAVEVASKYPSFDLQLDRSLVALKKFAEAENQCSLSNQRLKETRYGASSPHHSLLWGAREKIARLLGPFDWNEAESMFGWGPGATTRLPKTRSDACYKFSGIPETTSCNAVLARCAIQRVPRWHEQCHSAASADTSLAGGLDTVKIVSGNRVVTVPKNAKTDRVIAIEPDMNIYIQKGIGGMIRRRLKRVQVDLNDQTLNQRLAREGSITGKLATVDLSSASDTISTEIVRYLLPSDWFHAMDLCRSKRGTLPSGEVVTYQKFSSMGNGFTFELESLIFWSLVASVLSHHPEGEERRLGVYGDDLIFSSSLYPEVASLLGFCGFVVNPKKSFASGPFRESCGKHYFRGTDVTPFYIRKDVDCYARLIWLANSLRRYSSRISSFVDENDDTLYDVWKSVVAQLDKYWRKPRIPEGFGDGGLIGNFDEVAPAWSRRLQAPIFEHFIEVRRMASVDCIGVLIKSLSMGKETIPENEVIQASNSPLLWGATEGVESAASVEIKTLAPRIRYRVIKTNMVGQWPVIAKWASSS